MLEKLPSNFKVSLLDKELLPVPTAKELAVNMKHTVSKCSARHSQINRMKYASDRKTLTAHIDALVLCRLFYCSWVWCSTSKKNISKLRRVQNFGARIFITSSRKYDHIQPIFKELGCLPVESIVKLKDATMILKCMTGLAPTYPALSGNYKFIRRSKVHSRNTRTT